MGLGDIGDSIEIYEFDTTQGEWPYIEQVKEGQFCVGYTGPSDYGISRSFDISAAGDISEPANNDLTHASETTMFHDSCLRPDNIIVHAWGAFGGPLDVEAVIVAADGTITQHANNICQVVADMLLRFNLVHQRGDIVATVYYHSSGYAFIATVAVSSTGEVQSTIEDSFQLTATFGYYPQTCRVNDGVNLCVWFHSDNTPYARTVNVAADGTITATAQAQVQIATPTGAHSALQHLKDNWFVMAWQGTGSDGYLAVFEVTAAGIISIPTNAYHKFSTGKGEHPRIAVLTANLVCVACKDTDDYGQLYVVDITTGATITWTDHDSKDFNPVVMHIWNVLLTSDNVICMSYHDAATDGKLETHELESAALVLGHTELIVGLGP